MPAKAPNRFKYTGPQYNPVTQQYYLRARYYNPIIGRFMQEDVYQGDGLNLYAYCANNPVIYYDPSGYSKASNGTTGCPGIAGFGGDGGGDEENSKPYSHLSDGSTVGEGKNFTAAQKQKILEENMNKNGKW